MERKYARPEITIIEIVDDIVTASTYGEFNEPDPKEMSGDFIWGN